MNRTEENRLMIELFTLIVTNDEASARETAKKLDEPALSRLRLRAECAGIMAEDVFFEKRRDKRARSKKV